MTVIFGTLKDVGGQLAQGTVTVASLVTRPAHGAASTVITKERHVLPLRNGAFESPELDPGPVLVEAASGGAFESWEVTLPEDGRHDLATLIEMYVEYAPAVVGRVEAAAADANRAAQAAGLSATRAGEAEARVVQVVADGAAAVRAELHAEIAGVDQARVDAVSARVAAESARDGAVAAADRAEGAAGGVAADAAAAGDAAGRADVAAGDAASSAEAAGVSAGEAAASATLADSRATDAEGAVASSAAHATDAEGHADRAVAAREGAEAARDAAAGMLAKKADLVGGVVPSSQIPAVAMTRPHVVADRAGLLGLSVQEGDVGIIPDGPDRGSYMLGAGPVTEIGSWKRLVTPEAPVSSVNGQTGTVTLGAADVGAATPTYVDGKVETRATKAEVQARPAMWLWDGSGQWSAPPGAVDTDTVLNTATGEIHSIVEVTA